MFKLPLAQIFLLYRCNISVFGQRYATRIDGGDVIFHIIILETSNSHICITHELSRLERASLSKLNVLETKKIYVYCFSFFAAHLLSGLEPFDR